MPGYLFGHLTFDSEIPIHALPSTTVPEAFLSCGICPDPAALNLKDFGWLKTSADQTLFTIPTVGKVFVNQGKHIIVERDPDCNEELLHAYLTGVCFAFFLMQRHITVLHGSCICSNGKTLIISGESGAGKSTLSSRMLDNGWKLMTDDVVPIILEKGTYCAQSTFPCQKMWSDTVERRNVYSRIIGQITNYPGERQKYQVDAGDVFVYDKLPIQNVVYMTVGADHLDMREVTGFEKVDLLMRNRYKSWAVPNEAVAAEQFQTCVGLASQVRAFLVERPADEMTEEAIYRYILDEIEKV